MDPEILDEVGDAFDEDAGLPAAGTGDDADITGFGQHGFALIRIEG